MKRHLASITLLALWLGAGAARGDDGRLLSAGVSLFSPTYVEVAPTHQTYSTAYAYPAQAYYATGNGSYTCSYPQYGASGVAVSSVQQSRRPSRHRYNRQGSRQDCYEPRRPRYRRHHGYYGRHNGYYGYPSGYYYYDQRRRHGSRYGWGFSISLGGPIHSRYRPYYHGSWGYNGSGWRHHGSSFGVSFR